MSDGCTEAYKERRKANEDRAREYGQLTKHPYTNNDIMGALNEIRESLDEINRMLDNSETP